MRKVIVAGLPSAGGIASALTRAQSQRRPSPKAPKAPTAPQSRRSAASLSLGRGV